MTWHKRLRKRYQRGVTITEMTISTSVLLVMLAFGIPVFKTIGDTGDEGAARLSAQTENQVALLEVANELQNSSSTATDTLGNPRLSISAGSAAAGIVNPRTGNLDGFRGTIGSASGDGVVNSGATGNAAEVTGTQAANTYHQNTPEGHGSGDVTGTHAAGLVRTDSKIGAGVYGAVAARPRQLNYQTNSILRFQKVLDYTILSDGTPNIIWGPQVTYQVQNGKLMRSQTGLAMNKTVARHVVAFTASFTDMGTIVLTLVTQKQSNATGRVQYQANQIEVSPKN